MHISVCSFTDDAFNGGQNNFVPVIVDRKTLSAMQPGEVIVSKWPPPLRHQVGTTKFFSVLLPQWAALNFWGVQVSMIFEKFGTKSILKNLERISPGQKHFDVRGTVRLFEPI